MVNDALLGSITSTAEQHSTFLSTQMQPLLMRVTNRGSWLWLPGRRLVTSLGRLTYYLRICVGNGTC